MSELVSAGVNLIGDVRSAYGRRGGGCDVAGAAARGRMRGSRSHFLLSLLTMGKGWAKRHDELCYKYAITSHLVRQYPIYTDPFVAHFLSHYINLNDIYLPYYLHL